MTEFRFYHLTRQPLFDVLPVLLEMSLERGWRCVVASPSRERVEALNGHLWTYNDRSFLPHGSADDGHAADQPVWLTAEDENPNGAAVLFLVDGAKTGQGGLFDRVCVLFDGNDGEALATARDQWRRYRAEGHELSYWQQGDRGGWTMKQKVEAGSA